MKQRNLPETRQERKCRKRWEEKEKNKFLEKRRVTEEVNQMLKQADNFAKLMGL
jgi:hypothetical protein